MAEHDGCKGCAYFWRGEHEEPCVNCTQNASDNYERMTNADCIRTMSDEEFAEFWLKHCDNPIMEFNEDICDLCNTYKSRGQCDDEYCKEAIVKWLQSEVEEQYEMVQFNEHVVQRYG